MHITKRLHTFDSSFKTKTRKVMKTTTGLQKEVVYSFIIEMSLVNPVSKIITQLNNGDFRDCDIKWLDNKLDGYIEFAGKTLGIIVPIHIKHDLTGWTMNEYVTNYFLEKFTTLLKYFKTL